MRHVILMCKNHPELRWSCKEIAFTDEGGYDGSRNIFFNGKTPGVKYSDGSGFGFDHNAVECSCSVRDLVRAPEDAEVTH